MPEQSVDALEYNLGRGIDYLGSIARMLRDLSGYATLIYELLQNADDAPGATVVRFDVTSEAFIVWNDGRFSDCGKQDRHPDACPWLDEQGERCDFHRFRSVSAGDKGRRADLTGAFGIGFTAVYQITDQPELISSGQHWIIDETRPEAERIRVHTLCPVCDGEPGTRFILPWARDPNSEFRRKTNTPPVDAGAPAELVHVLDRVVPTAMLFLRRIRSVSLLWNSGPRKELLREDDGEDTLISDGQTERLWHVLSGDFDTEAEELRLRYPGKLEKSSEVAVAVPYGNDLEGLLCAYLPTEERTGLPFHVNADFFPLSERKRLVVEGYQGEWNRAAVQMAARVLSERILDLRDVCEARQLWSLLVAAHQAATNPTVRSRELSLEAFWEVLEPDLRTAPILLTSREEWVAPETARIVRGQEEEEAAQILSSLGGVFAHSDLREFCFRLPYERSLGLSQFGFSNFVDLLVENGLDRRYGQAIVLANTASEVFLDGLLSLMMWEERLPVEQAAKSVDEGKLAQRLKSQFPFRLGGNWSLSGSGTVARWYRDLYRMRHRVVHGGYWPIRPEARKAVKSMIGLETFVFDRLADRRNKYPRVRS